MQTIFKTVHESYKTLETLVRYDKMFNVVDRCGFNSADELYAANPLLGVGAHDVNDFGIAREKDMKEANYAQ